MTTTIKQKNMETFKVQVSKTPTGYCATMDALPGWIVGVSGSFSDLQREVKESIEFYVESAKNDGDEFPASLNGDYQLDYTFTIERLLSFYDGIITRAALSRLTGINEKQLGHYVCGRSQPRRQQAVKIVSALHRLGNELTAISV
jgi:predicted RNase H-like HicB family nuclease